MKIIKWDYVLGANNQKVPIITFKPTFDFLSMSTFNNNNLWVTLDKTGIDCLNGNSFKGIVDRSTDTDPCPADMSYETPLWTLTLPCAPYFQDVKGGVINLNEKVTPEYTTSPPVVKKKGKSRKPSKPLKDPSGKEFKFGGVELALVASLGVIIAVLLILPK